MRLGRVTEPIWIGEKRCAGALLVIALFGCCREAAVAEAHSLARIAAQRKEASPSAKPPEIARVLVKTGWPCLR